jgi:hypothetical protein
MGERGRAPKAPKSMCCVWSKLCAIELGEVQRACPRRAPRPPFHSSREEHWCTRKEKKWSAGEGVLGTASFLPRMRAPLAGRPKRGGWSGPSCRRAATVAGNGGVLPPCSPLLTDYGAWLAVPSWHLCLGRQRPVALDSPR